MKKYFIISVCLTGLLLHSCIKDNGTLFTRQDEFRDQLNNLAESELASYKQRVPGYPGGLAIEVITNKGAWFAAAGLPPGTGDQVHFRAASNTKTFTSTAILMLHQQGRLNIFSRITDTIPGTVNPYVPNTPEYNIPYKSSITIWELLHHRAGVFDVSNTAVPDTVSVSVPYKGQFYIEYMMKSEPSRTFTFDEMVGVAATCRLFYFPPDSGYHYSNTGYSILGKIIERVSGKTYQQFMMEDVMIPMGLHNSTMPVLGTDQAIPPPFANGFELFNDSVKDVTLSNISANVAEGNLITTPHELGIFLNKLLSGHGVLSSHTVNAVMLSILPTSGTSTGGYGCGITYTNNLGYGHNGAHEGYLSQMVYDPESGFTVVVFTNCWNLRNGMASIGDQFINLVEDACYKAKSIAPR